MSTFLLPFRKCFENVVCSLGTAFLNLFVVVAVVCSFGFCFCFCFFFLFVVRKENAAYFGSLLLVLLLPWILLLLWLIVSADMQRAVAPPVLSMLAMPMLAPILPGSLLAALSATTVAILRINSSSLQASSLSSST